ncbi:hypothetical protein GCM10017566_41580 [Amycolatopsis bartoniae]|uniref:Uncharacterized protein n=1 Tax=Amycolatopsis bartoniae TaxID=941986 RepID=A0A8H9IWP4_9PSEU|nr:hypothetical protein GCM10017566_41580 [Amycolatopsis bartoniae]
MSVRVRKSARGLEKAAGKPSRGFTSVSGTITGCRRRPPWGQPGDLASDDREPPAGGGERRCGAGWESSRRTTGTIATDRRSRRSRVQGPSPPDNRNYREALEKAAGAPAWGSHTNLRQRGMAAVVPFREESPARRPIPS